MSPHSQFPMNDPSQVGEARRAAAELAAQLGFDQATAGRLALVVTELGTNTVRHAKGGRLLLRAMGAGEDRCAEVLAVDAGPGMADVERCLEDGFSTFGTLGQGLGAAKRQADDFDIHSSRDEGTVVLARVSSRTRACERPAHDARFRHGAVSVAAPHEAECGDAWSVALQGDRAAVVVVDGLGHGPHAAEAARAVLACFEADPFALPSQTLLRAHEAARSTRGAAACVARVDVAARELLFCGAGNISARLLTGTQDRSLLSQHGTLGLQIRRLQDIAYPWPAHGVLVMHSDGLSGRWSLEGAGGLLGRDPTVIAAWLLGRQLRGKDDATVVVLGEA